MLISMYLRTSK